MPDGAPRARRARRRPRGMARRRPRRALRREPRAAGQAARRRRAPAGPPPSRPPVRARAPRTGLRQDRGVDRPRRARRRARWPSAGARTSRRTRCARWVDAQDHDALLGALNPVAVSAGDAVFVPAGVPHAIGDGILIAELQEPTDLSILLEWDGFGIADEQAATLGLGWDVALASVERSARDPSPLRGPRGRRRRSPSCCPPRPPPSSPPSASRRRRLGGAARRLRGRPRRRGRRHAGRPRREPRRRAARTPCRGARPRRRRPRGHRSVAPRTCRAS